VRPQWRLWRTAVLGQCRRRLAALVLMLVMLLLLL
jgi:hypothetical protein